MKIFKDVISNDEIASDMYPMTVIDDILIRFDCAYVDQDKADGNYNTGGNPSAEDEETTEDSAAGDNSVLPKVLNIVLYHRLVETPFATKKVYGQYLRSYLAGLTEKLEPERKAFVKDNAQKVIKEHILDHFKEFQFYIGENSDPEGCVACVRDITNEDGKSVPYMFILKDSVYGEKV